MHSRLYKYIAALAALPLTGGCVQMTRHSNMVVFGTNTSVGVRVGQSATSVPEVQLGYSRQEAVVMPLVANTSGRTGRDGSDLLEPCDLTQPVTAPGNAPFAVHPCSLVAIYGRALDSYSVLASFGARFSGRGSTDGAEASVGLAQYFATGMAAQMLALNGGAAVVAVSQAAENSAASQPSANMLASLYGNEQAFQQGVANNEAYNAFRTRLITKITATPAAVLRQRIDAFEQAAGSNYGLGELCSDTVTCVAEANNNDPYRTDYRTQRARYEAALTAWLTTG